MFRFCKMLSIPLIIDKKSIHFNLSSSEHIKSAYTDYELLWMKPSVSQFI